MAASPLLYRPRFVGWTALLAQLPFSIFISLWAGGFVESLFKTFLPYAHEIDEGFLTQHRKDIRLSAVREIDLRRGILQRIVGLGSVYVATQATGQGPSWSPSAMFGATSTFGSGATLMDIAAFAEAYDQIRHAVDSAGANTP